MLKTWVRIPLSAPDFQLRPSDAERLCGGLQIRRMRVRIPPGSPPLRESSNGKTPDFDSGDVGSNPASRATGPSPVLPKRESSKQGIGLRPFKPADAGSSPVSRAKQESSNWPRTPASHAGEYRFESVLLRHNPKDSLAFPRYLWRYAHPGVYGTGALCASCSCLPGCSPNPQ